MARIVKRNVQRGKPYEVRWSWWDYKDDKRRFGQERFATYVQAKAKKAELENKAVDGTITDHSAGKETFEAWAERWFKAKSAAVKPSTARSHRKLLDKSVLPTFGARPIRAISTGDVQDFVLELQGRGLAPNTIKHHYTTTRLVLAFAARDKAIATNPALDVELPTNKSTGRAKPEMHFLDEGQIVALAACMEPPYDLVFNFMCFTGLRVAEVAGLRVADLDLMRKEVFVRRTLVRVARRWEEHTPKSGEARRVPMPGWLAADLRDYLGEHPHSDDPAAHLWPGRMNGGAARFEGGKGGYTYDQPWNPSPFRRQFKDALEACGLPSTVRLHDLRHTYVSLCASAGVKMYRIAEYAGHSHEGITREIYTHLFDHDRSNDMELLPRPTATPSNVQTMRRRA